LNSTLAQENDRRESAPHPFKTLRSLLSPALLFATLGFLWFVLCQQLSFEWSSNERYAYGWFVPFFAAFLFWLRLEEKVDGRKAKGAVTDAEQRPGFQRDSRAALRRPVDGSPISIFLLHTLAFLLLAALLPIRLFEVANPDWRPLSWTHALIVVGFTLLVIGIWNRPAESPSAESGSKPDFHFNWPAVRHFAFPICFILVAVPWLTPIEAPLVQGLMRIVAAVATETLTLFGIPAQLEGNLIRVSNGVVGVSEACSGVRSLQTSLMIGLLFGELKRLNVARRVALVAVALTIALLANFGRTIFLVWIAATESLAAVEHWHDLAGYAIVGAVFLGTVASASALAKAKSVKEKGERDSSAATPRPVLGSHFPPITFLLFALAFLFSIETSVSIWYRWHERGLVATRTWNVQWPESAPNFRELPVDAHTREMLRYDEGREVSWAVPDVVRPAEFRAEPVSTERVGKAILYFFRWEPGTATVLRARAHRPDICLPAVGWRQTGPPHLQAYPVGDDLSLPFQQFSFVHDESGGRPLYAETFFCLREDRVRPGPQAGGDSLPFSHWSVPERWQAVRSGLRNPGQQVLEFVLLSHHPLKGEDARTGFATLVPRLVKAEKK